jgi:hypothetical protein
MLVALCPSCGGRVPVSVASPGAMHCPYCGYSGPTPPEVASELSRAAEALNGMTRAQRQLSQAQVYALHRGGCASALYVAFCVFLAVPFLFWTAATMATTKPTSRDVILAIGIGILPVLLLFVAAALGLRSIRRARRGVEQACAAELPAIPGQPLRCHVCGAELASSSAAVVRCTFCDSDNVVSASALEQRHARQESIVGDYERAIAVRSLALSKTGGRAWLGLVGGALLAPVAAFAITTLAYIFLSFVTMPADPSVRYVAVVHAGRCCFARLSRDRAGHAVSDFGKATPKGFARVASADVKGALAPARLIGQIVLDNDGKPARVRGLYRTPVGDGNQLSLESVPDRAAVGSCLPPGAELR